MSILRNFQEHLFTEHLRTTASADLTHCFDISIIEKTAIQMEKTGFLKFCVCYRA